MIDFAKRLARKIKDEMDERENSSVVVFLADRDEGKCAVFQYGSEDYEPMRPVIEALSSDSGKVLIENIISQFDHGMLAELDQMIHEELKKFTIYRKNEPCADCINFIEKSNGFGTCVHREGFFDGEEPNSIVTGQADGCQYFFDL